jgi:hypothetical protein
MLPCQTQTDIPRQLAASHMETQPGENGAIAHFQHSSSTAASKIRKGIKFLQTFGESRWRRAGLSGSSRSAGLSVTLARKQMCIRHNSISRAPYNYEPDRTGIVTKCLKWGGERSGNFQRFSASNCLKAAQLFPRHGPPTPTAEHAYL